MELSRDYSKTMVRFDADDNCRLGWLTVDIEILKVGPGCPNKGGWLPALNCTSL